MLLEYKLLDDIHELIEDIIQRVSNALESRLQKAITRHHYLSETLIMLRGKLYNDKKDIIELR